ncbi:glutamate-cysteine ligase-domain-containing protein [Gigaspora rosea]|uniref:Glutamate--cysteine ligase n=1 Tax=Gigaspora rosea TaxID=44941 RepID=A0A397VL40_9GLOM|nr:glutamate-cysteine ligase-domain-containing protein [Gigaspora rosea]
MGFLTEGKPLPWEQAKKYADHIRNHGINQFLSIYNKTKDRDKDYLLWGDEIEYMVIAYDDESKNAKLSLRISDILHKLQKEVEETVKNGEVAEISWHPEFAAYMIEGIPGIPYGNTLKSLLRVEQNMKLRRATASKHLNQNESIITLSNFPRFGCSDQFLEPHHEPFGPKLKSAFLPDEVLNPHIKHQTVNDGLRSRRGTDVTVNIPIFHDKKSPNLFPECEKALPDHIYLDSISQNLFPECEKALPDHIYLDSIVFGGGCCCLQVTIQACNIREARKLYDQLAVLGPIMLALTASTPIWRGHLSEMDCRWFVLSKCADERTKEERGLEPLKNDRFVINRSRCDTIAYYISLDKTLKSEYNDSNSVYDRNIYQKLIDNGVDEILARHVSYLFIRDPLIVYEDSLYQDDESSSHHFENIQSTNWQTVRFKPPPLNSNIGWRIEFRCMEVQITDFENAAFVIFMILLTRIILSYDLNFYIPISKVDENMANAYKRDALNTEKFWFRRNIFANYDGVEDEFEKMTINEIVNGKSNEFPGLINIIFQYLESMNIDIETRNHLEKYLEFIGMRASGKIQTAATWIRNFVRSHPNYKHDSIVSQEINYDLIKMVEEIQKGQIKAPELLSDFKIQ